MKMIYKKMFLADGRVAKYHRPIETSIDMNSPEQMQVIMGSWPTADEALSQRPEYQRNTFSIASTHLETFTVLEALIEMPFWSDGDIVDFNAILITITSYTPPATLTQFAQTSVQDVLQ